MSSLTIVVARLVDDVTLVKRGQTDIGRPHQFAPTKRAEAAVWVNRGTADDLAKASAYAATEGYRVLTFPCEERRPLEAARAALLGERQP